MDIFNAPDQTDTPAAAEYFTGTVVMTPLAMASAPARLRALKVRFAPGGRTNWHHHDLGQMLHVTDGVGRIQKRGEPLREIRAGDTVWIAPGEEHWHGAAPGQAMTHLAMQESADGRETHWLEPVSPQDYQATPQRPG